MKKRRIHFPIEPCKRTSGKIELPEHLPSLHGLQAWIGRRNAGKTTACVALLKRYMALGAIDRVILVSPTYESNRESFAPLKIDPEKDVIEPSKTTVGEIMAKINEEMDEWLDYQSQKKEYADFEKRRKKDHGVFSNSALLRWDANGFLDRKKPVWKRSDDTRPSRLYILCDDIMGTIMLRMGKGQEDFVNLCIKHRHVMCHDGVGYGVSIGCLLQSYSSTASLPRPIRENLTLLCLFLNSDKKQRIKIREELSDIPAIEETLDMFWDYACSRDYGFLCIDMTAKKPENRFRACYDEYLTL